MVLLSFLPNEAVSPDDECRDAGRKRRHDTTGVWLCSEADLIKTKIRLLVLLEWKGNLIKNIRGKTLLFLLNWSLMQAL